MIIDGFTRLEELKDELGMDFGEQDVETLNGYLTGILDHIPTVKDKEVVTDNYRFEILSVENNTIQKVKAKKLPSPTLEDGGRREIKETKRCQDIQNLQTSNIRKKMNDAKKGKIFTVIGREIVIAVKEGGADPANNSKLRDVIAKAKANNMPNDTIDRGIKKAAGDASADNYEAVTYEGYGPNGIAIIVEALTDNKNRTAANVRSAFTKGNGSIGVQGCVSFMFDQRGQIIIDKEECGMDADDLMMWLWTRVQRISTRKRRATRC